MDQNKPKDHEINHKKITTIKLSTKTKARLDNLKIYPRESYEEVMQRFLHILNICLISPERARMQLIRAGKERKRNINMQTGKIK